MTLLIPSIGAFGEGIKIKSFQKIGLETKIKIRIRVLAVAVPRA
jgi:hypothetical protein